MGVGDEKKVFDNYINFCYILENKYSQNFEMERNEYISSLEID